MMSPRKPPHLDGNILRLILIYPHARPVGSRTVPPPPDLLWETLMRGLIIL